LIASIRQQFDQPRPAVLAFIAALVAAAVYLPATQFQFVNWDDDGYVTANNALSLPWPDFLRWAFTTFHQANWHPLTWISLRLDAAAWGKTPFGYHLTNVLIHAANSFLAVILIWRLAGTGTAARFNPRRRFLAFGAGLIFALHPLHVESVAWVSERKDLLCAFFYLLSLCYYARLRHDRNNAGLSATVIRRDYFFCLFYCGLALMSKPMAVSLPLVMVLLDIYPFRRPRWYSWAILEKIPFLVITLISIALTVLAQTSAHATASLVDLPLAERLGNAARALVFYLWKGLLPIDLSPLYPLRNATVSTVINGALAGLFIVAAFGWTTIRIKKTPLPFVLVSIFAVMLLPILGLVQVGSQFAADRYMYLPLLPLSVGVLLVLHRCSGQALSDVRWSSLILLPMACVLAAVTYRQAMYWRNSETLWNRVLAVTPDVPTAHYNLANHYLASGRSLDAERHWLETVRLDPAHSRAYNQLGSLQLLRGDLEGALENYKRALRANPKNLEAIYNCAQVLDLLEHRNEALDMYERFVSQATAEYLTQKLAVLDRIRQIEHASKPAGNRP